MQSKFFNDEIIEKSACQQSIHEFSEKCFFPTNKCIHEFVGYFWTKLEYPYNPLLVYVYINVHVVFIKIAENRRIWSK